MRASILVVGAAVALAGCNEAAKTNEAAHASASSAALKPKHPTYCFFKDADTKGWTASRDSTGNVVVKGKGHLEDNRYAAQLSPPEVSSTSASLWLTMGPNTGPYGAPENWWDVSATIPGSSTVDMVTVLCGTKTVAQLKVPATR